MKTLFLLVRALPILALACSKDTGGLSQTLDVAALLADVSSVVIVPTYQDLEATTVVLNFRADLFNSTPTDSTLAVVWNAWFVGHRPWAQAEGFLFGPVVTEGFDTRMDSRPVDRVGLEAVLAGSAPLSQDYINGLAGTLKGFHGVEYVLFGSSGAKRAADFTLREREYLIYATASLVQAANALRGTWSEGGYMQTFASAGMSGNSVYVTQSAAVRELVNGMIATCDNVANRKIGAPFDQRDRSLEESAFSHNSNNDFADHIRGIQNIYLGTYMRLSGPGNSVQRTGIRTLVLAKMPRLDTTIQSQLNAAIRAIGEMTPNFGEAISSNPASVEAARERIRELKATLEDQVLPLAQ
jgi:putative iron-regulated protein